MCCLPGQKLCMNKQVCFSNKDKIVFAANLIKNISCVDWDFFHMIIVVKLNASIIDLEIQVLIQALFKKTFRGNNADKINLAILSATNVISNAIKWRRNPDILVIPWYFLSFKIGKHHRQLHAFIRMYFLGVISYHF